MASVTDGRSLGDLFGDLSREIGTIVRKEIELARTELSSKLSTVGTHAGAIVAGSVLAIGGLMTLLAALVLVLVRLGMPAWAAALVVGIAVLAIGGLMAQRAVARLKRIDLTPHQTIRSMKETAEWTKPHAT